MKGIEQIILSPNRNCAFNNNFYLQLVHAQSAEGLTYKLLSLYMPAYH